MMGRSSGRTGGAAQGSSRSALPKPKVLKSIKKAGPLSPLPERDEEDNDDEIASASASTSHINNSTFMNANGNSNNEGQNSRVRVIVRIRPLNRSEIMRGHRIIVQGNTNGQQLTVWDPSCFEVAHRPELAHVDPACWSREFAFDKCLWSLDPETESYASQDTLFEEVGQPVLNWILNGFNCCVFAFGQTGAGKSFSMLGDLRNGDPSMYGLVPRICFGLFDKLDAAVSGGGGDGTEMVTFSYMEIYNEYVRDLLVLPGSGYLRVREHPKKGVFVSNLTTVCVKSFEDVMSLIAIGDKHRTVASTNSNAHSSRSHAIVTLTVTLRSRTAGDKKGILLPTSALQQKVGRVHLVDLAGSERVTLSGAKGERLREANNINRSLSVLGDVIKCLGDTGKKNYAVHVPYRNSTLTMVLKDSLGGNAHAIMLTAISPSGYDYEETISTLKYADRAKRVRMRVDANVTSGLMATDSTSALQLVPILQAEVNKLREMLKKQQVQHDVQADLNTSISVENSEVVQEMRERVRELEQQLAERERLIESLDMLRAGGSSNSSFEGIDMGAARALSSAAKVKMSLGLGGDDSFSSDTEGGELPPPPPLSRNHPVVVLSEDTVDISLPRVINLNQDPLFSECLVYYVPEGRVLAGSKESNADILLSGPDIVPKHIFLCHDGDGSCRVEVLPGALVFINGEVVEQNHSQLLAHNDRIAFGRFHLFRYEAKGQTPSQHRADAPEPPPGWEFAQGELMRKQGKLMLGQGGGRPHADVYTMQNFEAFRKSPSPNKGARRQGAAFSDGAALSMNSSFAHSQELPASPPIVSISLTPPRIGSSQGVMGDKSTSIEKLMRDRLVQQREEALKPPVSPLSSPSPPRSAVSSVSPGARQGAFFAAGVTGDEDSVHSDLSRDYELAKENAADSNRGSNPPLPARDGSLSEPNPSSGTDAAWWSRLSRVAEGREKADPAELRAMLKTVVHRAEESIGNKGGAAPEPYPPSRRASVATGPLLPPEPSPVFELQPQRRGSTGSADPRLVAFLPPMKDDAKYRGGQGSASATDGKGGVTPEVQVDGTVFEKEAQALQVELAQMQRTLQERMLKYQKLVKPT